MKLTTQHQVNYTKFEDYFRAPEPSVFIIQNWQRQVCLFCI